MNRFILLSLSWFCSSVAFTGVAVEVVLSSPSSIVFAQETAAEGTCHTGTTSCPNVDCEAACPTPATDPECRCKG